jgi:hypothetical protein
MLAKRLAQRGVALSGGALAAVLSQNVASAGVPTAVVSSTIKAAGLFAAGQVATAGIISAEVAVLTEGVLKAMLVSKLKIATAVLLVVLLCVGGSTVAFLPLAAGRQPKPTTTAKQGEKRLAAKKAEDAFPGEWVWANGQKGGLTRIAITQTKDGRTIQAWGEADGKETDQGKTTLTLLRDYEAKGDSDDEKTMNKYGFAVWDHKFAKSFVTLRVENDRLLVEEYRIYPDPKRTNHRNRYEFKKKN